MTNPVSRRGAHIIIYAPSIINTKLKQNINCNMLLVYSYLLENGYDVYLIDSLKKSDNLIKSRSVIFTVFDSTDAFSNGLYDKHFSILKELKYEKGIYSILGGSIAYALKNFLLTTSVANIIICQEEILYDRMFVTCSIVTIATELQRLMYSCFYATPKSNVFLQNYSRDALQDISLKSSYGCNGKCSFCAYNLGFGTKNLWTPCDIEQVTKIIFYFHDLYGSTRVAFSDSDFGGSKEVTKKRSKELFYSFRRNGLIGKIEISLNIRLQWLDEEILNYFAKTGVSTILVGLESFSRSTQIKFDKFLPDNFEKLFFEADKLGISILGSYILWHPWQSITNLKNEIFILDKFGRHRIPQFLCNAYLRVIPSTKIYNMLVTENLLIDPQNDAIKFIFRDDAVEKLFYTMRTWYSKNVSFYLSGNNTITNNEIHSLAKLKFDEFNYLKEIISQ